MISPQYTFNVPAFDHGAIANALNFHLRYFGDPNAQISLSYTFDKKKYTGKAEEIYKGLVSKFFDLYGFTLSYRYEDHDEDGTNQYKYILTSPSTRITMSICIYASSMSAYVDMFSTPDRNHSDVLNQIKELLESEAKQYICEKQDNESYINFICQNQEGFYTHEFEISNGVDFDSIFDNYEDDFKEDFSDVVLEKLTDEGYNKGIVLLHGRPGTGKTTYLRYLLSKVKKKVMYLPPEMGHSLSDPSFITFLMSNPNSILCIEDAENIIKTREAGGNQAVSNILNITDGLLGSALKYQVICTFNAAFTEIDSALTRKGRMIGEYEFKALSKSKTRALVKKLYGEGVEPVEPEMTLGDIHTMADYMPTSIKEKKSIGFIS